MLVHTTYGHEREEVAYAAPAAERTLLVKVAVLVIVMVRIGRVHPPSVNTHLVHLGEILPVDVTCTAAVAVIYTYT